MTYTDLNLIAQAFEMTLVERQAIGEIMSYSVNIVPDDHKIDIYCSFPIGVKSISTSITIASKLPEKNNEQ